MSYTLKDEILNKIYDLNDELKVNLIEINSTKQLYINGPSQELLKRAFNISYYQGQKQAIEAVQKMVEETNEESTLINELKVYYTNLSDSQLNLMGVLKHLNNVQFNIEKSLDEYYHYLGQENIITQINHVATDFKS
ncbi:hypothetical protein BUY43_06760 [Staphylococcus devriesei]|uniref:Uncharacterized protein n=1 Tax=Staphylococcus devriesei TaxID=586733 RepID=A0A2K4DT55_9STAP|nr:hypothetical protein [Staphylococcus devriesei]MCE5090110.1 hypothetical protein [Staphylococcus devriesei]MCE5096849.1 hypothetical protein [Staphylococcus devriesei]PNZ90017.1 hypothetical protein CD147_01895 [Staphylococcus devriesei]PTE73419.1 hypothetical protein BUY44_05905 [Staphylococcus devriesei]PTF03536.1 hypothetical protein BUY45_07800 [Staphylococcus devriesei]